MVVRQIDGGGLPLSTGSNFSEIGLEVADIWGIDGGGVIMTMTIKNGCGVAEAYCFYLCSIPAYLTCNTFISRTK